MTMQFVNRPNRHINTDLPMPTPTYHLPLAGSLTPRIGSVLPTFTRASTGTYIDPDDGLLKRANVNHLLWSEELDATAWSKLGVTVTANDLLLSDGRSTDKVARTTTGVNHISQQSVAKTAAAITYTSQCKAVMGDARYLAVRLQGLYPARADVVFDLQTGVVVAGYPTATAGFTAPSASIVAEGGGEYRCIFTATTDTHTGVSYYATPHTTAAVIDAGDASSAAHLYIRDAMLEQSATPTKYAKTEATASAAPRFEAAGLLVEGDSTNLLLHSEEFDNAVWGKNDTLVTSNTTSAPDGTLTADTVEVTSVVDPNIGESLTGSSGFMTGKTYTWSIYVKENTPVTTTKVTLYIFAAGGTGGLVNLKTKVVTLTSSWQRVSVTQTFTDTTDQTFIRARVDTEGGTVTIGDKHLQWGAQLEELPFASSYIPTSGAAATRAVDAIVVTPVASFFNATEGTSFVEMDALQPASYVTFARIASFSDGTASNELRFQQNTSGHLVYRAESGGALSALATNATSISTISKAAGTYTGDALGLLSDGGALATDSVVAGIPSGITQLNLNATALGASLFWGHLKNFRYYPKALTTAQLQRLTR